METAAAKNDKENTNPEGDVQELEAPKVYTIEGTISAHF